MLDQIEEEKYRVLKAKCRELKVVPPTDIFIGLQVHKDGKLIFDDIQRGHSWTRNYWNYIFAITSSCTLIDTDFGAGHMSCFETDGSYDRQNNILSIYGTLIVGASSVLPSGIVVGTGSTAFDIEQYALASQIANGSSAGTLYYNASTLVSTTYTVSPASWTIVGSRVFNNNSGGDIVVAESGLIPHEYTGGARSYWLVERSLIAPAVTVPDGAQLTVIYTIVDDFSAID